MKKLAIVCLVAALAACNSPESTAPSNAPAPATPTQPSTGNSPIVEDALSRYMNHQLIVGYEQREALEKAAETLGATIHTDWNRLRAGVLELPTRYPAAKARSIIEDMEGLRYVEFNRVYDFEPLDVVDAQGSLPSTQAITVSDPEFGQQWMHRNMNTEAAWELGATGKGIRIGIHDDYIDHRHPDLAANMLYPGFDGNNGTLIQADTPHDRNGTHGTAVAGTAAASGNDIRGRGIAFEASIVPLAISDAQTGSLTDVGIVNSGLFAVEGPDGKSRIFDRASDTDSAPGAAAYVHVVNMSWGGGVYSQINKDIMDYMLLHGIVLVTSAGNTPIINHSQPAWLPGLITVAATDPQDRRTAFSNRGRYLNVGAPGERIWTAQTRECVLNGVACAADDAPYQFINGTSFSSPATAGVVALMLDAAAERDDQGNIVDIPLGPAQVRQILEQTANQPSGEEFNLDIGFGVVDAGAAVQAVKDGAIPEPGGTVTIATYAFGANFSFEPLSDVGITLIPQNVDGPILYGQTTNGGIVDLLDPDGSSFDEDYFGVGLANFVEVNPGSYLMLVGGPSKAITGLEPDQTSRVVTIASGDYGYKVVTLDVELYEDTNEPNDTAADATAMVVGTTQEASLDNADGNDIDVYSFEASTGLTYVINTETITGNFDIELQLATLDANGDYVLVEQNSSNQDFTSDSAIVYTAESSETHYIIVSEATGDESPGYVYALDLSVLVGSEQEPNGSADVSGTVITNVVTTDAQAITVGDALLAEIATKDDDDIFAVALSAGDVLVVDIETQLNGQPDTMLGVYDGAGNEIASNDDFTGRESRVTTDPIEADGTYYIVVVSWDNQTTGSYTMTTTTLVQ